MKTLLTSLLSFIVFYASQAISFISVVDGSVLCNNITSTTPVPDSLQIGYAYSTKIQLNEETRSVAITHNFTEIETKPISIPLESITTDLNNLFSEVDLITENNGDWIFTQTILLDSSAISTVKDYVNPFKRCFEYKYNCESITIYVKELRPLCPTEKIQFTTKQTVSNDSIFFTPYFKSTPNDLICTASGNTVVTDSVKIMTHQWKLDGKEVFNLKSQNYSLFMSDSTEVECITTPCPSHLITNKKLGDINYNQCPEPLPIFSSGSFTGSALCNNLTLVYNLPKALQNRFVYEYEIVQNEATDSLFIRFTVTIAPTADTLKKIEVPLSEFYSEPEFILNPLKVTIIQSLSMNAMLLTADTTFGNPYNTCYEIDSKCIDVNIYRKSLRKVCSPIQIITKNYIEIKENVLLVDFIESTNNLENVCLAEGFLLHTDTITVTESEGLKNKDYRVFLGTHIECALGACPTMWLYEPQIGNAFLSNCIINGFEDELANKQLIFPNPAQDYISIKNVEGNVTLTNQFGQQFKLSGVSQLAVSNLPKGLYIATFSVNGKQLREKVVIQ